MLEALIQTYNIIFY